MSKLQELRDKVAEIRAEGREPHLALLNLLEAEEKRASRYPGPGAAPADQAAAAERRRADQAAEAEKSLKVQARARFVANGGRPEDFEGQWPDIKKQIVAERTAAELAPLNRRAGVTL